MKGEERTPHTRHTLVASLLPTLLCGTLLTLGAVAGFAQVSPAEVLNPQLRALEETYLTQLKSLSRAIRATKFPFPFVLSRYVGLDPEKQSGSDTRGLEFVKFHERVVLKITGNYNAAYNANLLTRNQRASRAFREVIVPVLQLVIREMPGEVGCDAMGFEIAYHVRKQTRASDFEGKEILVVVLDRSDAFAFLQARDQDRQEILNHSEIYVNGEDFGLALSEHDPFNIETLARSNLRQPAPSPSSPTTGAGTRLLKTTPDLPAGLQPATTPVVTSGTEKLATRAAATSADVERLQAKYQAQLGALAKSGVANLQVPDYALPSFAVFHNQIVLQLTLRNSLHFDRETSSIYKRAAQSFDLFLAPQLKTVLEKIPSDPEIQALDITLLNQLAAKNNPSSEALEFVCPLKLLRQFVEAEITNQELINQSVVLVNGVRIALNLQQVE